MDTHTHTRLTALFLGLPVWAGTEKVKPIWILLKQETVSGSGISWAICKSAPRSRQITMPAPHHWVFYRPDALPAAQPTASKHWMPKDSNRQLIDNTLEKPVNCGILCLDLPLNWGMWLADGGRESATSCVVQRLDAITSPTCWPLDECRCDILSSSSISGASLTPATLNTDHTATSTTTSRYSDGSQRLHQHTYWSTVFAGWRHCAEGSGLSAGVQTLHPPTSVSLL